MITGLFKTFTMLGSEWVMWLLMATSLISVAVMLERFRALRSQERIGASLWNEKVEGWMINSQELAGNDFKGKAELLSRAYPSVEGGLIELIAKADPSKSKDDLNMVAQGYITKKKLELEKNVSFLGTIGNNAPFIGLFGTVLGIIKAFSDLGTTQNTGGMANISSGISEALVATAIGLLVAIPAVFAFNYFQRKIKIIISRAESLSSFMIGNK